ncbi:MAG: DUF3071 domain-containing protein [Microbacterium sp.]|nr:DUF3071 domain-containing protein [Microbacterium sp.]MBN9190601.1 DUF3071 domain-containing protein [Microbacterium sp.]
MEQLRVIGSEEDALVLATESGERFTLAVDEVLRAEMRRSHRDADAGDRRGARPRPRDIQAQIRAGLSTEEVAEVLGVRVEDVVRYEGPVLAERQHMVGQALAVPVLVAADFEHDQSATFGAAVRAKLAEAGATDERWTSWKEPAGWVVKLEFTAGDVTRDARWTFDPRRSTLAPLNADATQLSRQGSLPEGLIPRLRALDTPLPKDDSRFDSGAFGLRHLGDHEAETISAPAPAPTVAVQDAAIKRAPAASSTTSETADLLEALRRRRGQREPLPTGEEEMHRQQAPVALFDALEPGYDESVEPLQPEPEPRGDEARASVGGDSRRKGRPSMPSWDEIVFGARTEDS